MRCSTWKLKMENYPAAIDDVMGAIVELSNRKRGNVGVKVAKLAAQADAVKELKVHPATKLYSAGVRG